MTEPMPTDCPPQETGESCPYDRARCCMGGRSITDAAGLARAVNDGVTEAQLREEIEAAVVEPVGRQMPRGVVWRPTPVADAVLALPAVRALLDAHAARHEWQCPSCGATTRARMADR